MGQKTPVLLPLRSGPGDPKVHVYPLSGIQMTSSPDTGVSVEVPGSRTVPSSVGGVYPGDWATEREVADPIHVSATAVGVAPAAVRGPRDVGPQVEAAATGAPVVVDDGP